MRPAEGGFEVVREGHRRGPFFADREAAERCMAGHLQVAIAEARGRSA